MLHVEACGETWVRYRTPDPKKANPLFVKYLVDGGADVVSVSALPQSLEDVYLTMIGAGTQG